MVFNLSVVNISSDVYANAINAVAEYYGCGANNLSVKLIDSGGNIFWGCHSFWNPDDYLFFKQNVPPDEFAYAIEAFQNLYERVVLGGDSSENWFSALNELGLTVVQE